MCWKLFGSVNFTLKAGELFLSQKLFLLVEPTTNIDAHIAETEVERLLRKMLLKLISTVFPITLNPSMQFLVFILLSWLAGMHQEAFKRHVSIVCLLWPLSNLGRNLDFKVLFALQDYVPFHCAHDLLMATCKKRTLCESPLAKSLTECHTHGIQGVFLLWHWLNRTSKLSEVMVRISSCRFPVQNQGAPFGIFRGPSSILPLCVSPNPVWHVGWDSVRSVSDIVIYESWLWIAVRSSTKKSMGL